jgi:hypothetical protein
VTATEECSGLRPVAIAFARRFYADQVMGVYTLCGSFPSHVGARTFGFVPRVFFDIEEPVRAPSQVEFPR